MRPFFFILLCIASVSALRGIPRQQPMSTLQPVHIMEGWSYEDCGLSTDPIQIESISVTPDPPQPGQPLTVKVRGKAVERINEGAYADVTVKLGLVKLLTKRFDVCEEARNAKANVQCPVEPGTYDIEQTVNLPKEIPKAKFTVDVLGFTAEDEDMLCLRLKVDFMKKPFPFW